MVCVECSKTVRKNQIVKHTMEDHKEKLEEILMKYQETSFQKCYTKLDIENMTNEKGMPVHIGTTGKFYCGGEL